MFLLSAIPLLASNVNPTAPITELTNYGVDFTDTDGDGMTDFAELKYGFDPNDKNSFPSTDYTFLSDNRPTLYESTGVLDPKNQVLFEFTYDDYLVDRAGRDNLHKLKTDREFINLAMPILLHELGTPPDSFVIEIRCQNRGVYANGFKISVNSDSPPQSFIHEIGHAWKDGWRYSFMKSPGAMRRYFRGFEEGFAEALTYIICNKFAEAYPTHPLVKNKIATSGNAQTWRSKVYDFDLVFGEPSLHGGTFWSDKYTEYRYENAGGAFTVIANQRDGVLRDFLRVFYAESEQNPSWDWTRNANDIFELWEQELPQINGIDTSDWLNHVGLFNGKPIEQKLYVSYLDEKVFIMYPDKQGNFSWKYSQSAFDLQNIPSWFPTKNVNGEVVPNVSNLPFNVSLETINNESVMSLSKKTYTKSLGLVVVSELIPSKLPIGLYRVNVEFPTFKLHTSDYKTTSYIIGSKNTNHPEDKLSLQVGLDIPNVKEVQISLNAETYKTNVVNGVAIFRFDDIGIDFTGMSEIMVNANGKTNTYKRAVSHFGLGSGERLNQFLIVDSDFDGIEDAFDKDVVGIVPSDFVSYLEIKLNADSLANPTTEKVIVVQKPDVNLSVPKLPPSVSNPINVLLVEIASLKGELKTLEQKNHQLVTENNDSVSQLNNQVALLKTSLNLEIDLVKSLKTQKQQIVVENNDLTNLAHSLKNANQDLNASFLEMNMTIQKLETNLSNQITNYNKLLKKSNSLLDENEILSNELSKVKTQVEDVTYDNNVLRSSNYEFTSENESLNMQIEELIKVSQVPFTSGWFYDPEDGWLYTDETVFPFIYKDETAEWYYYQAGTYKPRLFFSYKTQQWEEWE